MGTLIPGTSALNTADSAIANMTYGIRLLMEALQNIPVDPSRDRVEIDTAFFLLDAIDRLHGEARQAIHDTWIEVGARKPGSPVI
ncbi:hypothetical protein HVPorG_04678 (plasmid) [Roseomonas mucosa]|uniref:Uncharacterized protein n=1 Tax=Roseomonas mucosa TaxID=207340 RepID=A0A4Y1MRS2_9PROT|nr:hypothetical protein [Roseomonas mucosa]AWV20646.1 hypothetical protein RADP37_04678 [Roseomonas mucosa]MDT8262756.1 hypothetical protein [Roseomonas sp. DSM 102946]QDJ12305.1 hypothetical protein HVPorG_04678 [Roseomonas mucosa]